MVDRKKIVETENMTLYEDCLEVGAEGNKKLRTYLVIACKKNRDFMKDDRGRSMHNVSYESNDWYDITLLSELKDLFDTAFDHYENKG